MKKLTSISSNESIPSHMFVVMYILLVVGKVACESLNMDPLEMIRGFIDTFLFINF